MIAPHPHPRLTTLEAAAKHNARRRAARGFSLTELLVVIGIIILLIGLLLVALRQVRAKALASRTQSVMAQFANGATAFQAEHGMYPGVIPEDVILANPVNGMAGLSYTENALLHMMGGYRVLSPNDYNTPLQIEYDAYKTQAQNANTLIEIEFGTGDVWKIAIDRRKIGEGPVINGKPYGPYFTPGPNDIAAASYNYDDPPTSSATNEIPDLLDGWGDPIIYLRQVRSRGPLVNRNPPANTPRPQFLPWNTSSNPVGVWTYLSSTSLGESGLDQSELSIFGNAAGLSDVKQDQAMAVLLGHPAFYKSQATTPQGDPLLGSPRGAFFLWSAGADGVYMSRINGTGSPSEPIDDATVDEKLINPGPRVLDEFDDVRYYGGG